MCPSQLLVLCFYQSEVSLPRRDHQHGLEHDHKDAFNRAPDLGQTLLSMRKIADECGQDVDKLPIVILNLVAPNSDGRRTLLLYRDSRLNMFLFRPGSSWPFGPQLLAIDCSQPSKLWCSMEYVTCVKRPRAARTSLLALWFPACEPRWT